MDFILICGISCSGKTTYSELFENVIHLDDFHTFKNCNEAISHITGDTYLEGIYITKELREELLNSVPEGFNKVCIFLNTPLEECLRRKPNYRPEALIIKQFEMLELPTEDEGWDEIITIQ